MTNRDVWNIVLIALAVIGAITVIGFIGRALMGVTMGGMMNCGVGMAGGWLVGLLLIAIIAGAVILLLRRRPQHSAPSRLRRHDLQTHQFRANINPSTLNCESRALQMNRPALLFIGQHPRIGIKRLFSGELARTAPASRTSTRRTADRIMRATGGLSALLFSPKQSRPLTSRGNEAQNCRQAGRASLSNEAPGFAVCNCFPESLNQCAAL